MQFPTTIALSLLTLLTLSTASPLAAAAVAVSSTSTSSSTAAPTGGSRSYPCNATVPGNGIYTFRNYQVKCGQAVPSGVPSPQGGSTYYHTEADCLRACNSNKYCEYASYTLSSGRCDTYYAPPAKNVADGGVDALILVS